MSRSRFESGYLHDETPVMNYYYFGVGGVTFAILVLGSKTYDSVSLAFATSSMYANSTPGTFPCSTDRCKACPRLCADTSIRFRGPNGHMSIKRTFTCQSLNLVSAITCQSCNIYVGETSRSLMFHFLEHLADIHHNRSKPVAQHFNSASHTIADVKGL